MRNEKLTIMEIKIGQHFWAKMDKKLVMMMRYEDDKNYGKMFFVCGAWECNIWEKDFEVIELVNFPKGYTEKHLYYI